MGSHPSDKVPQLTKNSFTIINSAPSNDRGEHWIVIARLNKIYYFANFLGQKRTTFSFLTKKYWRMLPKKLQKTDNFFWMFLNLFSISSF